MSGSPWEPALMIGVLFGLLALSLWHLVEPYLLRALARTVRIRETCAIAFYYLPRMCVEALFLFVLGEIAWQRRAWLAAREARRAFAVRENRGYPQRSEL